MLRFTPLEALPAKKAAIRTREKKWTPDSEIIKRALEATSKRLPEVHVHNHGATYVGLCFHETFDELITLHQMTGQLTAIVDSTLQNKQEVLCFLCVLFTSLVECLPFLAFATLPIPLRTDMTERKSEQTTSQILQVTCSPLYQIIQRYLRQHESMEGDPLTSVPAETQWKHICQLCIAVAEALNLQSLRASQFALRSGSTSRWIEPLHHPMMEPLLCFFESFGLPLVSHASLMRLHDSDEHFMGLTQVLDSYLDALINDYHRNPQRPVITSIWEQGLTKKPTFYSVYVMLNLIIQLAMKELQKLTSPRNCALMQTFLKLGKFNQFANALQEFWWHVPMTKLSELDEKLYLYDDTGAYLFQVGDIRIPELVAIGLTTKKATGPSMRQLISNLITSQLAAVDDQHSETFIDLLSCILAGDPTKFGLPQNLEALNTLYFQCRK